MRLANILLIGITLIFIIIAFVCRIDNPWYGSSVCFPLGILYAQREEAWNRFLYHKYWQKNMLLLIICGVCILLFFILGNDSVVGNPIARNVAAGTFCLWIISLIQKWKVDYKICTWLGKISYEIFLLHPIWISVFSVIPNKEVYSLLVIGIAIVTAWFLHIPLSGISKHIRNIKIPA